MIFESFCLILCNLLSCGRSKALHTTHRYQTLKLNQFYDTFQTIIFLCSSLDTKNFSSFTSLKKELLLSLLVSYPSDLSFRHTRHKTLHFLCIHNAHFLKIGKVAFFKHNSIVKRNIPLIAT